MNEDYDANGVEKRAINPFQHGFAGQTHALRIRRGLSNYNNHALRVRSMPRAASAYAHALRVKKDPPVYNRYTRYSPVGHALRIKKGGFSGFNHALRVRRGGENEVHHDGYFCKGFGEFISSSEISRIIYNFDQGKK